MHGPHHTSSWTRKCTGTEDTASDGRTAAALTSYAQPADQLSRLPDEVVSSVRTYLEELLRWNRTFNLTAERSVNALLTRHVIDSVILAEIVTKFVRSGKPLCLDIGSGAGLPGIPLRMLWQKGTYILLERKQKRASFLRAVLAKFKLPNTLVLEGDLENVFQDPEAKYDLIVNKASLPLDALLARTHSHVAQGGVLAVLTTRPYPNQADQAAGHMPQQIAQTDGSRGQNEEFSRLAPLLSRWSLVTERRYRTDTGDRSIWLLTPAS